MRLKNDKIFPMHKLIIFTSFFVFSVSLFSQVSEGFEDGDFTQNPVWTGYQDHFQVNTSYQLQLDNDGEAAISSLQTINQIVDSTSWEFFIKLAFSPSSNNYARVYLASNNEDIQASLNGYFLQFGEAGSDDAIELFRQDGESIHSICRGNSGAISSSFNAKIKLVHYLNGLWMLYADFGSTGQYALECQGVDNTYHSSSYFGFYCEYTSSNASKFYFDDIEIKHLEVDDQAPKVISLVVSQDHQLSIKFSEALNSQTAENTANYEVNQGIGNPTEIIFNQNELALNFSETFILDQNYQISIRNISDILSNVMNDTLIDFMRSEVEEYDVLINEIMADPSPVVGLPNVEYLEIYNSSDAQIDLSHWILQIGDSEKEFPNHSIPSKGFLILCKQSNMELLSSYGECVGFSSFSLTNSGQSISLSTAEGHLMHAVEYTTDWYHDSDKDDGGWSIEQINPGDFCSGEENWSASEHTEGGTPGSENSIYNSTIVSPKIKSLEISDNPLLLLTFTQQMLLSDILNVSAYSVSPDIGAPQQLIIYDTSDAVYLTFNQMFEEGVPYTLLIDKAMHNCVGEAMQIPLEIPFVLPKKAEQGDVVINEIMADPEPSMGLPAYEYIELFNNAEAPIDLSQWTLQIGSSSKQIEKTLMPSKSYLILTSEEAQEFFSEYGASYGFSSFSLANTGAQLVLKNKDGAVIHELEYKNSWYKDEDKAEGGWSLEAIDSKAFCVGRENFMECIGALGGTPATLNSRDGSIQENEPLKIQRIEIVSVHSIRVYFNQKMDSISLGNPNYYEILPAMGQPIACEIEAPKYNSVVLSLPQSLEKGVVYTLETFEDLMACNGENASALSSRFAIPDQIARGDIVFNEVLFNAAVDDGEYIELVNVSDKILETAGLSISRIKINTYDTSWYTAHLNGALLFPEEYVAFTPMASQVLKVYYSENPERIISNEDFPSLPNDQAQLLLHLRASKDSIIDELEYFDSWHYSMLNHSKGVSLEKINLYGGNQQSNWHSAASSVNYGSPAYQNSQYKADGESPLQFELVPEIFSPDNDGFDDVLQINYQMDNTGYTLNLVIYDSKGRKIKHLVQNELLATTGSFYWDGETENHEKAAMGIYILLFEYFDLNGQVKAEKLSVVLGGYL